MSLPTYKTIYKIKNVILKGKYSREKGLTEQGTQLISHYGIPKHILKHQ